MLSVKQDSIKNHFLSLWYDSTCDWTQVSRAIGKRSNHYANVQYIIYFTADNNALYFLIPIIFFAIWCSE